jgi:clusterin-associated protein 1
MSYRELRSRRPVPPPDSQTPSCTRRCVARAPLPRATAPRARLSLRSLQRAPPPPRPSSPAAHRARPPRPRLVVRACTDFTEMMRALGYPRPISMENFRNPNFDLVADVLRWLVKRYEPTADISDGVSNMQDRVIFLKQAAQLMQAKGRIKLNTKRLYQADGYAVKELIKIAQVLYSAIKSNPEEDDDVLGGDNFTLKLTDLKNVRDLAVEITDHGSQLAELLSKEDSLREARQRAIARNAEMADIQKIIKQSIQQAEENKKSKADMIKELEEDERRLKKKLEKKSAELDRNEKRFHSLQNVRPAFMDEYELLEDELQDLFRDYLERYRNLDYIESQLEAFNREERARIEEHERDMKAMQKKIKEEEMRVLRGDVQLDENDLDDSLLDHGSSDEDDHRGGSRNAERPKTKSGARANVQGSLAGGHDDDDDESLSGSDADLSVHSGESEGLVDEDSDEGSDGEVSGSDVGSASGSGLGSDDSENSF